MTPQHQGRSNMRSLFGWARTQRHQLTPAERALRLLWSPEVLEISDAEFAEIGRLLGLEDTSPSPWVEHPTTTQGQTPQQQEAQVVA